MSGRGKGIRGLGKGGATRHSRRLLDSDDAFKDKLKTGAIKKLARIAGIKRIGRNVYDSTRDVERDVLFALLLNVVPPRMSLLTSTTVFTRGEMLNTIP
ncbi:histone H4, putative [Perkinsus marinus ATCC 50983]|uniref:Histone H4, putative n=1 Tax=Perkinsus marinus (strain ATCC 50983 / TXsc) TaxID=423536 RepID=C5KSF4_PERM5|nr:histone H4, putative [Perkinsus marinus ATCC 50983]EER12568.1 histone H4, putative [Perkinsus marinus ATCC 50983]|eukprot:XP_002780773.1 histone H4, putative [Perkinsus marinus ATCC 50983]